jgi:putative heme iron utilization protein
MTERRQHAYTTAERDPDPAPETSHAERARTLLHLGEVGVLSTHSRKREGYPFGSLMPYAIDPEGRPLVLISTMAMHTRNLLGDPRASLFVAAPGAAGDPLGAARVTLIGDATPVPDTDVDEVRAAYLERHANASYWVDFEDFVFYRLDIVDAYFVGGFGVMGWVEAEAFRDAEPDPLAEAAPGILKHMNADHADALLLLAHSLKGIEAEAAEMTAVDRLGFHVRLKTPERMRSVRIGFREEVRSPETCREALVAMVRDARR